MHTTSWGLQLMYGIPLEANSSEVVEHYKSILLWPLLLHSTGLDLTTPLNTSQAPARAGGRSAETACTQCVGTSIVDISLREVWWNRTKFWWFMQPRKLHFGLHSQSASTPSKVRPLLWIWERLFTNGLFTESVLVGRDRACRPGVVDPFSKHLPKSMSASVVSPLNDLFGWICMS